MEVVPIHFNGSGSYDPDGTIVSYLWTFGDGNNATGATPTHTYAQNGTYTVTLTVADNGGATNKSTITVNIEFENLIPFHPCRQVGLANPQIVRSFYRTSA